MDFYRQNPDSFDIIFGTDVANDYLDDMLKLFKENNG
jgi:phosphotransferase system IIB component